MVYDPKRGECYCPVCGYTTEVYEISLPPMQEEDIGSIGISSNSKVDKGLGNTLSEKDALKYLQKIHKGSKRISISRVRAYLSSSETKTFRKNLSDTKLIISNFEKISGIKIPRELVEEAIRISRKLFDIWGEKTSRYYNSYEVFVVSLYHVLIFHMLSFHKDEILDHLAVASQNVFKEYSIEEIKKRITKRYTLLLNMMPKYDVTIVQKAIAVSQRFGIDPEITITLLSYLSRRTNILIHSFDNTIFALVYFIKNDIMGENVKDDIFERSGVQSMYALIRNNLSDYEIELIKEKYGLKRKSTTKDEQQTE